jgi:hypothetical protein
MIRSLYPATWCATAAILCCSTIGVSQTPQRRPTTPLPSPATQSAALTSGPTTPSAGSDIERLKIWNSAEMVGAREWVRDHSRRSVRFTPQDADAYLARLRQLSPQQMQQWLQRYHARQANITRSQEVARAARQMSISRARAWQQEVQRTYANLKIGQAQAALMAQDQYQTQSMLGGARAAGIEAERAAVVANRLDNDYSWLWKPNYYTQRAAAISLPGNLPAGDPRNFIRGDVPGPGDGVGVQEVNARGDGVGPEAAADVRR